MKVAALIKLLRIHSWYYLLGIPLLAVLQSRERVGSGDIPRIFGFASVYYCWGYVFNNLFDLDEDSASRNPFKSMHRRRALFITCGLQLLLLVLAFANGVIWETLAVILLNVLYSVPPLRLKRLLLPSLFANGVFFSFPYYTAAKILNGHLDEPDLRFTLFVFCLFLPIQFIHSLEHREEEGKANNPARKWASCVLFGVLCWATRSEMLPATIAYCVVCLSILFIFRSAGRSRKAVTVASMVFGAYLAFSVWFGGSK